MHCNLRPYNGTAGCARPITWNHRVACLPDWLARWLRLFGLSGPPAANKAFPECHRALVRLRRLLLRPSSIMSRLWPARANQLLLQARAVADIQSTSAHLSSNQWASRRNGRLSAALLFVQGNRWFSAI